MRQISLYLRMESVGFVEVLNDLQDYDLDKTMARSEIIDEIKRAIGFMLTDASTVEVAK